MIYQDGDKIIVTELRPMSEIPEDVYVLVHDGISLYETRAVQGEMKDGTGEFVSDRLGWIQMPQYRPEATPIDPEGFRKGVKALFDYLQDRVANNYHANSDQMAELQKMNKVFEDWLSDALQEVSENDYHEWMDLHQAYAAGIEKYKRDHERYEKLRKLNVQQFSELYERNLRGEGSFDDLVSRLP